VAQSGTKIDKSDYSNYMTDFRAINRYNRAERFLLGTAIAALALLVFVSTVTLF
jgi:hypothetical protein